MDQSKQKFTKIVPVVETLSADLLTPLAVYLKLSATGERSFLLESVEGGKSLARYSFIGAGPTQVLAGGREEFEQMRRHFAENIAQADPDLPAFIGGAIGLLGFDCCEWFEPKLVGAEPEFVMMFFDSIVAFDHARQVIKIISLDFDGVAGNAESRNAVIRKRLEEPGFGNWQPTHPGGSKTSADAESNWKREDFENAVREIKELIRSGECYQTVLSQCFTRPTKAHPVSIYRALRSMNPSPYMFLLDLGDRQVVGASPEMLVRCENNRLEYRPIAGTRKRGKTPDEDTALAEEMRLDKKEVAEHLMLVDLGRNDLGRVAEYGSVKVDSLMHVEKYSHVQHLVSSLSAKLRVGCDRFDAFAACFPAGTVSGAPKVRSIEIIRELEPNPRGVYAGAVGYFDYSGNMDMCIAIRTLVLKDGIATIQAGAGIVADSVPEMEFAETVNKAKGLLRAVEIAEIGLF